MSSNFSFPAFSSYPFARLEERLAQLTQLHGASGFEKPVRDVLHELWAPHTKKLFQDNLGNLFAQVNDYDPSRPSLFFMGHMDEIGLFVREITKEGFIEFGFLGGWLDFVLLAQRWVISTKQGPIRGYSGIEPPHQYKEAPELPKNPPYRYFIDIGARSKEEAMEWGIRPGLPITPDTPFCKMGSHYFGKALDNRAALTVMTELLSHTPPLDDVNLFFIATVQEEVGLRGAQVAHRTIEKQYPDITIAGIVNIEVGLAQDFPLMRKGEKSSEPALEKGPALFVFDRSMIPDQSLLEKFIDCATAKAIPFQYESRSGYGQDGSALQLSGMGLPCINVGIPTRYVHSHGGLLSPLDLYHTIQLFSSFLSTSHATKTA